MNGKAVDFLCFTHFFFKYDVSPALAGTIPGEGTTLCLIEQ
jgi:hypothetical protein